MAFGRRFCDRIRFDEVACVSVRDGAVRLIFAGWLPQDGLFGRSASAGLSIERGFGVLLTAASDDHEGVTFGDDLKSPRVHVRA